jgi:hypothetical protein
MMKDYIKPAGMLLLFVLVSLLFTTSTYCITSEDIISLKNAGVEDETIQVIINEQADLTGLINVREVIRMKKAGVSDKVIRALASPRKSERRIRQYGTHVDQIKEISTKDIIQLREAGFDDSLIEAIIHIQQADQWQYLFDLGIITCPEKLRQR